MGRNINMLTGIMAGKIVSSLLISIHWEGRVFLTDLYIINLALCGPNSIF